MQYENFKNYIRDNIKEYLPPEYAEHEVRITKQQKNNNVVLDAVLIHGKGQLTPVIYLEPFYHMHERGTEMEKILQEISDTYLSSLQYEGSFTVEKFQFEGVKDSILVSVLNAEMNEKMLQDIPHEIREDLALVYRVKVELLNQEKASILLHNSHLEMWGVGEESVKEAAWNNMHNCFQPEFLPIKTVLKGMLALEDEFAETTDIEMYVLTNKEHFHGAAYMFDEQVMGKIADELGADLLVLPSSIHETLIMKMTEDMDMEYMKDMVRTVNRTQLAENEILSNEIYQFQRDRQILSRIEVDGQTQGMNMEI